MRADDAAYELLRDFEGLRLYAYLCPAGVWTIGYGHTGEGVRPGMSIKLSEAEALLKSDVEAVEQAITPLIKVQLNTNQFGALVCFAFNIGMAAFARSTLLARLNRGEFAAIPNELRRWSHARGIKLPGLVRHREAETALWCRGEPV